MSADLRDELVEVCRAIDAGDLQPRQGAARIWSLMAEADYPPELESFRIFVGLISELQDHPEDEAAYVDDIRNEARQVLVGERDV